MVSECLPRNRPAGYELWLQHPEQHLPETGGWFARRRARDDSAGLLHDTLLPTDRQGTLGTRMRNVADVRRQAAPRTMVAVVTRA